jgi:hypothetical protein
MKRLVAAPLLIIITPLLCGDTLHDLIASVRQGVIESRSAAENGLKQLQRIEESDEQRQYSLIKPMRRDIPVGLGPALPLLGVPLDQLKNFDKLSNPDPLAILIDTHHVLHVVLAGDEIVSVVEVVHRDPQGWTTAALGQQFVAERALDVIQTLHFPVAQTVLVKVGGLRLIFVGFERDGLLTLAPINDVPELGLTKGMATSALPLFRKLAPVARTIDGTIPN